MSTNMNAPKMLAHLRLANETSKRYQENLEKQAAVLAAVKAAVPDAIAALETHERIFGHQKEVVAEKIATDHLACIELIRDLAKQRNAAELTAIGSPVGPEKKANDRAITGAPVADFDDTESGQAYRNTLMGRS